MGKKMNRFERVTGSLMWVMALLTVALTAGCGGGGQEPATGSTSDNLLPTVSGTINANGAVNVAINTKVGAMFSEGMDHLTISTTTLFLMQGTTVVPGSVSYSGVSAVFAPSSNLAPGTLYIVTVKGGAGGVKDLAGNPMAKDYVWAWTTGASSDTIAPTVSGTINANGAVNVPINTKASATFSEGMDHLTISTTTLFLKQGTTVVPGSVSYSGVSAVFAPSSSLVPGTLYIVTVKGGVDGVKDLAGNSMASDYVWAWTTSAGSDTIPPTVSGTINANGATNVAINTKVGATFSEGMDPLTVSTKTLFLMQGTTAVPGTVSYSGVSAVFAPLSSLAPGILYTATVKGGAGGVKDLAGNSMASDYVWAWTTSAGSDTVPPVVIGTTVANGAVNVPIDTIIGATFSEGMDPLTITNVNCTLAETLSGIRQGAATVAYSGVSVEFDKSLFGPRPRFLLLPDTSYTVTIKGGIGGVEDLAGNPMVNDYAWSFTTGAAIP
jgi:hypothetical protein